MSGRTMIYAAAAAVFAVGLGVPAAAQAAPQAQPSDVRASVIVDCGPNWGYKCAGTLANVNIRTGPGTSYAKVATLAKNMNFALYCYQYGESINGDPVWYFGAPDIDQPDNPRGFVAGYWLATGKDPAAGIEPC